MPRLQVVPIPLVQQLTELHASVLQSHRDALGYARRAGDVLRQVPPEERAALAQAAAITGRSTRFDYVAVSENWLTVQHAGSIRQALKMIRRPNRVGPFLWHEWPAIFQSFEDEGKAFRNAEEEKWQRKKQRGTQKT